MSKEESVFQRSPHDKENPYVMVSRSLIRDKNISPHCRMLLIYLLSHADGWQIKARELINHFQGYIGKNQIYEILQEAIDAGYMKREEITVNNLKKYTYYISEFKKFFRCPDLRDTENWDSKEITSFKNKQIRETPPSPSASFATTHSSSGALAPPSQADACSGTPLNEKSENKDPSDRASGDEEIFLKNRLKKEGIEFNDSDFEVVYGRLLKQVDVKSPFHWIKIALENLQKEKDAAIRHRDMIERRRSWAEQHEYTTQAGGASCTKTGYEVVSGTFVTFYPFDGRDDFWQKHEL